MTDRQILRLCKKIMKLQSKLFDGKSGENYMDIYARNGENGMPCVGITLCSGGTYKRASMVDGVLLVNDL